MTERRCHATRRATTEAWVIEAIRRNPSGRWTRAKLAEESGIALQTIHKVLKRLRAQDRIHMRGYRGKGTVVWVTQ